MLRNRFIFSLLTAVMAGGAIALVSIFTIHIFQTQARAVVPTPPRAQTSVQKNTSFLADGEEDPTFVSRFSRVFIYSADSGREVIESAKKSLPTMGNVKVTAPSYVVMDMDRKVVVLEKDADRLLPLASVTKLVTAVMAQKLLTQTKSIVMNSHILATYGNEAGFREGEKMRVNELFYPLLLVSSNDAAEALAQSYSGGREQFLKEMNSWVNSIGAYRTYFADPAGLSEHTVSTARDLSIITQWILEHDPDIFNITLIKSKTIRTHTWTNPTHFLNLSSYAGGKNGYTPEADRTSVSLFRLGKQKRLYGVMILGSSARDNDILDLLDEAVR